MSIITEALIKAQEKRKSETYQKIVEIKPLEKKPEPKVIEDAKPQFSIKTIAVLGIIIALSAAFLKLMPFFHKPEAAPAPVSAPVAAPEVPKQVPQPAPKPNAIMAPYKFTLSNPAFEFSLEGIIFGNGAPIAIINKHLVGVGDTVKGAIVSEIREDEVVLDYNGEELVLQLN